MPELKDQYSRILKDKTANAFSDGKASFHYRRERFTSVLAHFSLPQDNQFIDQLLESYEETLVGSLDLKCGAISLLSTLKGMGKKIVIITGGPQDAQEGTMHRLGIGGYVDFLATTNCFGVTKTNGPFPKVLERLGICPGDIAYIGDNEQRDMKPAMAEGIFSIHLAETEHVSLNTFPPQINTLRELQYILWNAGP
jgi:putative hydrolase of the HAD superfamily